MGICERHTCTHTQRWTEREIKGRLTKIRRSNKDSRSSEEQTSQGSDEGNRNDEEPVQKFSAVKFGISNILRIFTWMRIGTCSVLHRSQTWATTQGTGSSDHWFSRKCWYPQAGPQAPTRVPLLPAL